MRRVKGSRVSIGIRIVATAGILALMAFAGVRAEDAASPPYNPTVTNETPATPDADVKPPPAALEIVPSLMGNPADSPDPLRFDLPHDMSPWGMFMAADIVVKTVMIGLAIASFITWTVWAAKAFELWIAKRLLRRSIRQISATQSLGEALEQFGGSDGTGATLIREAGEEVARSLPLLNQPDSHDAKAGIKERVTSRLSRVEANAARRMTLGTGVLATIGATAPFVGLFGTVWGIMNSFISISVSKTTNLAVVAPGIAEALLATALGLVAAIPAVIIYNVFARSIAGYRLMLSDASAGIERLVSWELDARHLSSIVHHARAAE